MDFILKRWITREKIKEWLPYSVILAVVLLAEIFIFNFSTWKTLGCEPIVLATDVVTDTEGVFSTGYVEIQEDVKNVNVDLNITNYDRAFVTVSLTDEGDYYAYQLPQYTVVPGVEGCGYQNIYSFGTVNTIQIMVEVPQGTQAQIQSIGINVNRPMDFKIIRVGLLFGIFVLGYLLFTNQTWMRIPCIRGNKWQIVMTAFVLLGILLFASVLVKSNPVCVNSIWPHHRQYQELARALEKGTVVIDDNPHPALLEKENPYDTSALLVEGITFRMDYAFYNGNYYAYFGIIPELLFFLPYYLLTGQDMQNYLVVFFLYCGLAVGVFGTLWEVIQRYAKKVPYVVYLLFACSVCLLSNYVFMLGRPDIYNIPVMAGNAFIFLGTFCWLKGMNAANCKWLWYGSGALAIACIAGCRPQLLLYGILLFMALLFPAVWQKKREWKRHLPVILSVILPVLGIAAVVFWYNLARFDSGFNFGATYSLTSNDMNNRGFNFSRLVRGLYSFLFQPPVINSTFPFLESCELEGNYMGKNTVEFCFGGIFATFPLLLSLGYTALGGYRNFSKEVKRFIISLCLGSFVIAAFDINAAGILQRYMGDMVFGFVLASVIVVMILLDRYFEKNTYIWLIKGSYICVLFGLFFSFLVFIASGDSVCLERYHPSLFYWIASYFKF